MDKYHLEPLKEKNGSGLCWLQIFKALFCEFGLGFRIYNRVWFRLGLEGLMNTLYQQLFSQRFKKKKKKMHVSLIQVPRLPPAAPEHQMTLSNTKLKRWLSALWKDNMSQVTALACSHSCCHLYLNFHLNSKFTCFHCNNNNTYSCECSSHAYRWRLQGSCSQVKLPCRVVHSADMGQFSSFIILFMTVQW